VALGCRGPGGALKRDQTQTFFAFSPGKKKWGFFFFVFFFSPLFFKVKQCRARHFCFSAYRPIIRLNIRCKRTRLPEFYILAWRNARNLRRSLLSNWSPRISQCVSNTESVLKYQAWIQLAEYMITTADDKLFFRKLRLSKNISLELTTKAEITAIKLWNLVSLHQRDE